MAQRVITQLVSDLSGEDIADGNGQTVKFGWLGADYTIDLTDKEVDKFAKALEPYLNVASKVSWGRRGRASSGSGAGSSKRDTAAIREWWRTQGHEIGDRGRIPAEVVEAYNAAH